jgi:D-alanine transfer protein
VRINHLASLAIIGLLFGPVSDSQPPQSLESQYVQALAPRMFPLKSRGSELQREALQNSDLLLIYGSSELAFDNPYHASTVFASYPTDFTIFPVGGGQTTSLIILEDVAAEAEELKGHKIVISVSPAFFLLHDRRPEFYAPDSSDLHLSALVFSPDLSLATKQAAAKELQNSPEMLKQDPEVALAVDRLASGSAADLALYEQSLPSGEALTARLHSQDVVATTQYIQSLTDIDPDVPRQPAPIDWQGLLAQSGQEQQASADNNPFGFDNQVWTNKYSKLVPEREAEYDDAWFVDNLDHSAEFTDLDVLLRGLSELGAQPLVISQPIPGVYYDYVGVSQQARMQYYSRLRALCSQYGVPVVDFEDHDDDQYFVTDPNSHLSRLGWVYYDQALDAFFHGTLDQLDPAEWSSPA